MDPVKIYKYEEVLNDMPDGTFTIETDSDWYAECFSHIAWKGIVAARAASALERMSIWHNIYLLRQFGEASCSRSIRELIESIDAKMDAQLKDIATLVRSNHTTSTQDSKSMIGQSTPGEVHGHVVVFGDTDGHGNELEGLLSSLIIYVDSDIISGVMLTDEHGSSKSAGKSTGVSTKIMFDESPLTSLMVCASKDSTGQSCVTGIILQTNNAVYGPFGSLNYTTGGVSRIQMNIGSVRLFDISVYEKLGRFVGLSMKMTKQLG